MKSLGSPIPYDTNTKMNPPLREAADRDAMLAGIADGSVDAIATDHAPHHYDEKNVEFDRAPFGIVGLETAVSLSLDRLVHSGLISAAAPGRAALGEPRAHPRVPGGSLSEGQPADITVLAPDLQVRIEARTSAVAVEEHTVRRLGVAGRRRGDDRRRPAGVRERRQRADLTAV